MTLIYLGLAAAQCCMVYAAYKLMHERKEGWGWFIFALIISFSVYPTTS